MSRIANQTALERAFRSDNPALLQLLLESQNPALKKMLFAGTSDDFGLNMLLPAALAARNRGLLKTVLALGPNLKDSYYVNGALRATALGGDLDNLKALLAAGAPTDPQPRDPLNETTTSALLEAARGSAGNGDFSFGTRRKRQRSGFKFRWQPR